VNMLVRARAGVLKLNGDLDYANVAHTTSDINAALSITGSVVQTVRAAAAVGYVHIW